MMELGKIEGKTFIITGGANGLGAAYVEAFIEERAKNVAILDVDEAAGKLLEQKINKIHNNKVIFVKCDVSIEADIQRAFDEVSKTFKQVDVIINNAGILNDSEQVWRKSCDVNIQGLVSFTRKGVSYMRKDEGGAGGTIINIASTAALIKMPVIPAYCGTKAAVLHFSLSLAEPPFYDQTGVRILTICFGPTKTTLLQNLMEKTIDKEATAKIVTPETESQYQNVECAVAAMLKMFKHGSNASVWLATNNRPAENITHAINSAYENILNVVVNGTELKGEA